MNKKQKKILNKIILTAILFLIALLSPFKGNYRLIAFLVPYLIVGYNVLWSAITNIFKGHVFDEEFLMAIASIGAFVIGEYPEAVAVMLFFQVGELFENVAVGNSRKSISKLMDIKPDYARLISECKETTVSPEEINIGDIILVKPGEKIPLDGVICSGQTTVNTSALTGESIPSDKFVGDKVYSGSVNVTGVINIEVESAYADSTVSKILNLVENSYAKKAKTENFITRFANYYTPVVVICAFLLAVIPTVFFGQEWSEWLKRALIFLVVSCPCAIVVSIPLSFFGAIGGASKKGILIKGANYIEALAKVKTVVFDKTGTLTKGSFKVNNINSTVLNEDDFLKLVASVESYSNHPIAESIIEFYGKEIDNSNVKDVTEIAGMGLKAQFNDDIVHIGNEKLMDSISVNYEDSNEVGTVLHVSKDSEYLGYLIIADELKEDSKQSIIDLNNNSIDKTIMLTGDKEKVGKNVAEELGIDEVYTNLLPQNKVEIVEELLENETKNSNLAFVGDGINDAPVLSRADVGIAMGGLGSDAAIEAADIVLMDDKPSNINKAIDISKYTMRIVWENLIFSLAVKFIILILGALGFANMWLAVFGDVGVLIIAILNSIRTLKYNKN